jgi:hypothetical protein
MNMDSISQNNPPPFGFLKALISPIMYIIDTKRDIKNRNVGDIINYLIVYNSDRSSSSIAILDLTTKEV